MKTKLNPIYWLIILFGFDYVLLRGILSGDITNFLHPKMIPFIVFSLIVFIVLTIDQIVQLVEKREREERIKWGVLIYVIPISIGLFNPQQLSAEAVANRSANLGAQVAETVALPGDAELPADPTDQLNDGFIDIEQPTGLQPPNNATRDDFATVVNDIQFNLDDYIGKTLTLKGFVFRADSFTDRQFVVGRLLVTCCVADAGILGVMVDSDNAKDLQADQWVEVTGTVAAFEYSDPAMDKTLRLPQLVDVAIKNVAPLASPYIYE